MHDNCKLSVCFFQFQFCVCVCMHICMSICKRCFCLDAWPLQASGMLFSIPILCVCMYAHMYKDMRALFLFGCMATASFRYACFDSKSVCMHICVSICKRERYKCFSPCLNALTPQDFVFFQIHSCTVCVHVKINTTHTHIYTQHKCFSRCSFFFDSTPAQCMYVMKHTHTHTHKFNINVLVAVWVH
jgi:hypothetical protein